MGTFEAMKQVLAEINRQKLPYTQLHFLKGESEGIYFITEADTLHLTFDVADPVHELQMTITFTENYFDILTFLHPVIIRPECVADVIRTINQINSFVKIPDSSGKFYIDEEALDFVYSARVSYRYFQIFPELAIRNGVFGFQPFLRDAAGIVFGVAQGTLSSEEACEYISKLWG